MERFADELKAHIENPRACDEIERGYDALVALKRPRVEVQFLLPEFDEKGGMPFDPVKVLILFQLAIRRGIELADSMIRDANAFSYTPVWTSSRSLFELSALVVDTKDRVAVLLDKWDHKVYQDFSEHIDQILLGFKSKIWHPKPQAGEPEIIVNAKNVLTMIERIDKKKVNGFMGMYELLSEVAHPNYMGMMEQYQFNSNEMRVVEFVDAPLKRDKRSIGIPLETAHVALGFIAASIGEYDKMFPVFARACDDNLNREAEND